MNEEFREPYVEGSIYLKDKDKLGILLPILLESGYHVFIYREENAYIVKFTYEEAEYDCDDYFLLTRDEAQEVYDKRWEKDQEKQDGE